MEADEEEMLVRKQSARTRPRQRPRRRLASLAPAEVLALAIHVERANAEKLERFGEAFAGYDDEVARLFDDLASQERQHEESLVAAFRERFGQDIPPVDEPGMGLVIESVDLDEGEHQIFHSLGPAHVVRLALRAEHAARDFYERAALQTGDVAVACLYRQLAVMEAGHAQRLEQRLSEYNAGDTRP